VYDRRHNISASLTRREPPAPSVASQPATSPPILGDEEWITLTHEHFSISIPTSFQVSESWDGFEINVSDFIVYVGYFGRLNDFWE